MKWMSPLDKTWRGEVLALLWAVPIIALFVPPTRPWALSFFENLKGFSDNAPEFYIGGWALIFAATFGLRQALTLLPGRYSRLVTAMAGAPSDVPDQAAAEAQDAVTPPDDNPGE